MLAVDDNATNRRILHATLMTFGCEPSDAASGPEALDRFRRAAGEGRPFDLILLDVQMPDMSGLDVLEILRKGDLRGGASVPVIVMTSVSSQATLAQGPPPCENRGLPQPGWSATLTKPVKQSALLDVMMEVMGYRAAAEAPPVETGRPDAPLVVRPLRVLLAEDNEINRRLARAQLEGAGHKVTCAENGREVLDTLLRAGAQYDVIFMDVQMSVMDGLEATAAIRSNPAWAGIPIIAMTAHAMKGDREWLLAAGMDDYISKPVRGDALQSVIERQMQRLADSPA